MSRMTACYVTLELQGHRVEIRKCHQSLHPVEIGVGILHDHAVWWWWGFGVTSWAGQHLHQLVRDAALSHTVNQRLDVPETVNGSKLQQSLSIPLQSDFLEIPVPTKPTKQPGY